MFHIGQRVRLKNCGGLLKMFNGRGGVILKRIANHVWRVAADDWCETNLCTSEIEPERKPMSNSIPEIPDNSTVKESFTVGQRVRAN